MWYLGGFKLPPQPDHVLSVVDKKILKKIKQTKQEKSHFFTKGKFPEK